MKGHYAPDDKLLRLEDLPAFLLGQLLAAVWAPPPVKQSNTGNKQRYYEHS